MSLVDWVDTRRPWLNLLLTAGLCHGGLTLVSSFVGLGWYAVFGFGMKEGEPLVRWAFRGFKRNRCPYKPSRSEEERGWTVAWKVADSVADFLVPALIAWFV